MMQAASLPKISIVMPVLNREDTIEKAIRSVIDQQYENTEFIILDGGSKDGTVEIIKRYEKHLAYWHSQPDKGAADATNVGIKKATGDFIAIFMADDWYEPGTFLKIAETILANPDADMITCAGRIVRFDEKTQTYQPLMTYTTPQELSLTFHNICFAVSAICCRFIRQSLYDRIGLYLPLDSKGNMFLTNDKEFLLRAVLYHAKDIFVNHLGHTYLAHQASFSFGNNRNSAMRHCQEHMEIAETYLEKPSLTQKQKWFLMYWYNDQSARLVLYHLLNQNIREACSTAKTGMQKYPVIWPMLLGYTTVSIFIKRIWRKIRSYYAQAKARSEAFAK